MIKAIFYISIGMIFYSYFGYPISLAIFSFRRRKRINREYIYPVITIIITAFNEEKRIQGKLENIIASEYPKNKLQVVVVSDGSTDRTNEIVKKYENSGVELLEIKERRGKENAQKEAISQAQGDVIIFTDVATAINKDGLKQIVSNFADPSVGCVSSEDKLIGKDGKICGEGLYVRYEMWLRRLESDVYSLVGLSGSFFAARKEVCKYFSGEMQSDFMTVLNCVRNGLRGVCDPNANGYYQDVADDRREFDRKVRTVVRGLTVYFNNYEFLNIFKYGVFSYEYFCHKLLRWMVPFFLVFVFVTNTFLLQESYIYITSYILQILFYGYGIFNLKYSNKILTGFNKITTYYLIVNTSVLLAWWKYLNGHRIVMWDSTIRSS